MIAQQLTTSLQSRLNEVHRRIERAAERSDREPRSVILVAVTKSASQEDIKTAYELGLRDFGENRVHEALTKFGAWCPADVRLHMIGSLQSNKAKQAAPHFDLIHSVDRRSLIEELDRQSRNLERDIHVLLQVNVAAEAQKSGCPPAELPELLRLAVGKPRITVLGLMTMAPFVSDAEGTRPIFRALKDMALRLQDDTGSSLPILSMGMSNDYEVAIEEGATHVRIGRAVFGNRFR